MAQRNSKYSYDGLLQKLICKKNWSQSEAKKFFAALIAGRVDPEAARAFLILLREKGESAVEIVSAAAALRSKAKTLEVDLPFLVDNCGTGGDGKASFNVSTVAAFIAAAAGAHVAKHGNRSVSSKVGSADLLESLGVQILAKPAKMLRALREVGIGYFHAPLYHPIMKRMQGIRKKIRGRTIFNLLGPLMNPLGVKRQVIGICREDLVPLFASSLEQLGAKRAFVICGARGMDEATPFGKTRGIEIRNGRLYPFYLEAEKLGFRNSSERELRGGSLRQNRAIALGILKGEIGGAKKDAALLNSALTLLASGVVSSLRDGLELSRVSVESGKAYLTLRKLVEITN